MQRHHNHIVTFILRIYCWIRSCSNLTWIYVAYTLGLAVIIFKLSSHPRPLLFSGVCTVFHVFVSVLRWCSTCLGEQSIPNCCVIAFETRLNEVVLKWLVDLFPYFTSSARISNIKYSIGFDHLNYFSFFPIIYC